MLHYMLDFPLHRYIMCNAKGREDGSEKADVHLEISRKISAFILCEGNQRFQDTRNIRNTEMAVHDFLAELVTDCLDESIGMDLTRSLYGDDFTLYAERFFKVIIFYLDEISDVISNQLKSKRTW